MDDKLEILLNSRKNVESVDVDCFKKIQILNKEFEFTEYNIRNVINATEIFYQEREDNEIYRIYGRLEYLSLLNNLNINYILISELYNPIIDNNDNNKKTIFNSFDFYLTKPSTNAISLGGNNYARRFEVIATPSDFELSNAGFSMNVFGEQTYQFNFNKDFDVSQYFDKFGFPITELFLYVLYKPHNNGVNNPETVQRTVFSTTGLTSKGSIATNLTIGSDIYGDKINYDLNNYSQEILLDQTYYITTSFYETGGVTERKIVWKYNPFIPIRLRYLSEDLYKANSGDTSYETTSQIPEYATKLDDNGNFVWRNILPQGYFDPLTNIGVDYPFVNKKSYLFNSIIIDIVPDLSDVTTYNVFRNIKFEDPTILNETPSDNIDNIGNPC